MRSHSSTAFAPTSGRLASQTGGGASLNVAKFLAQTAISSRLDTIAAMAKLSGTTKTQSNSRLITTTAKLRLFHNTACSEIMKGHVATTTLVAQTIAPRSAARSGSLTRSEPE